MFAIMLTHKRIVDISWLCLKYRARGTILAHLSGIMDSRWTVKYIQNAYMYGVPTGLTVGYHKHMIIYWTVKETSYEYNISTWPFTYRMLWKPFKLHSIPLYDFPAQPWLRMMLDCIFPENDTCKTLVVELCRRFKITTFLLLFSILYLCFVLSFVL